MGQKVSRLKYDFEKNPKFMPIWEILLIQSHYTANLLSIGVKHSNSESSSGHACKGTWKKRIAEKWWFSSFIKNVSGNYQFSYFQIETITIFQMNFLRQSVKLKAYRFYFFFANDPWLTDWAKLIARVNLNGTSLLFTSSVFTFLCPPN